MMTEEESKQRACSICGKEPNEDPNGFYIQMMKPDGSFDYYCERHFLEIVEENK